MKIRFFAFICYVLVTASALAQTNVIYAGLTNTALGNASLALSSNQLIISDLGSNGLDGVSIDLPDNFSVLDLHYLPLDDSNALPDGAYITLGIVGTAIDFVTNDLLGDITWTKLGETNYALTADYSPLGVTNFTVQAFFQGVLIAQVTNQPGTNLAKVPTLPYTYGPTNSTDGRQIVDLLTTNTNSSVSIIGSNTVVSQWDHLSIIGEDGPPIGMLTTIEFTASQVPVITLTALAYSPLQINLSQTNQGMALQWFGTGTLQQSSDLINWSNLSGATSPYSVPMIAPYQLFRILQTNTF